MAWWAMHRTPAALRIGTFAGGVWIGGFVGWALATTDEPFGEPAAATLMTGLVAGGVCLLLVHGWAWRIKPGSVSRRPGTRRFAPFALACCPSCLIDLPDAVLSLYRDAAYYATFDPANPVWPPLPAPIQALTDTCMWTFLSLALWALMAVLAHRQFGKTPPPDFGARCDACGYDLRGTQPDQTASCPECGADTASAE